MNDDHTFAPEMTAEEAIQMVLKRPEMYGLQKVAAVPDAATEAQVEAAAKALHETRNPWFAAHGDWGAAGFEIKQAFRESARAALTTAGISPLWCGNDSAHDAHSERNQFGGVNECTGRPNQPTATEVGLHEAERLDRAALVAAHGAAPQAEKDIHEPNHDRVYCVRCGGNWPCQPAAALPSSGVDEDKLAEVIGSLDWGYMVDGPSVSEIARAVAEWLKGQK